MEKKRSLHRVLEDGEVVLSGRGKVAGFIILPFYLVGLSFILSFVVSILEMKFGIVISSLMYNAIFYGIMMLTVLLVFGKYLWASFTHALKQRPRYIWIVTLYLGYFAILATNMVARFVIALFTRDATSANQDAVTSNAEDSFIIMTIIACVCAPIIEEVIFRSLLFRGLSSRNHKFTVVLAGFFSALLFAGMHVFPAAMASGDLFELIYLVSYFPMGVILAVSCYKTKNIFGSILLHAFNNIVAMVLPMLLQ